MKKNEKIILIAITAFTVLALVGVIFVGNQTLKINESLRNMETLPVEENTDNLEAVLELQAEIQELSDAQSSLEYQMKADSEMLEAVQMNLASPAEVTVTEADNTQNESLAADIKKINESITNLQKQIDALVQLQGAQPAPTQPAAPAGEAGPEVAPQAKSNYNYVAIGNSICKHPLNQSWWSQCGMAATSTDNDYVHLVTGSLQNNYNNVKSSAYNFNTWEYRNSGRSELLGSIDGLLNSSVDLVTLQLSDNVSDTTSFQKDFNDMVKYVKKKAPNAQIIIVDDFWDSGVKHNAKINVANANSCGFVDLSAIKDNNAYKIGLGATVYDESGAPHIVESNSVADHPNDAAMQYIANGIVSQIQWK